MNCNPVEVIRHKRDGLKLTSQEIEAFVSGAVRGVVPEYQVTAFLMSVYFQGMDLTETTLLTKAMIESGKQIHFEKSRPKIDKHSTGGIGDKVSLILAPLVASLGVDVPMVAGRGLGHTGGTLDKLESIPGFQVRLAIDEFTANVAQHGVSIMGQTEDFVPADKLLYALRDVTATVDCIPLITASILSKKVAEGISGLVMDIKTGSGAFMKTQKDAEKLAKSIVAVGSKLGLRVRALLTDMSQPLGCAIGHSLEVLECLDILRGKGPLDLRELTVELAAHMLVLGEQASALSAARSMAKKALQNGSALKKFREMCVAQHATADITEHPEVLEVSPHQAQVLAPKAGYVSRIDGEELGLLLIELGGGRRKTTDTIDHGVGYIIHTKIGQPIKKGDVLVTVYYNPERIHAEKLKLEDVLSRILASYSFSASRPAPSALVKKVIE